MIDTSNLDPPAIRTQSESPGRRGEAEAEPSAGPKTFRRRPGRAGGLVFGYWWWALPGIVLVVAVHYVATAVGGAFAFTNWSGIGGFEWTGLDNFARVLRDPGSARAIGNTLLLAFGSVILSNVAGLLLALGANRIVKTRHVLRLLFFMPVVLSPLAVAYIWKFVFDYAGPVNTVLDAVGLGSLARAWLGDPATAIWAILVVLVWQNTGFAMVIYMAGLAAVPVEIEEAAALDGAGLWQRFRHVVLPSIMPAVAISTTLGLVNGLRVFDQILALTGGGPAGVTETLATEVYKQAFSLGDFGYGAALALILTLIILAFAITQQRLTGARPGED
ncbi:sugar ABC transporter permease [Microbacterium yannicii]|uniref:Sugar ABC transporter permease n=1 Tax=Microbacterium yannicii TaxID=671622 RepID=A0ABP9MFT1_9MICO|nr:sugar ABC transporter permease [Microbacterium yannicii]MCO5952952.1 sugar ABC transporter permease [Microbacterium yannicii]